MSDTRVKFLLEERDIPSHWVNLMADLPEMRPRRFTPAPSSRRDRTI
jgi:predicted alternative tryptophan synthase beta-subunit